MRYSIAAAALDAPASDRPTLPPDPAEAAAIDDFERSIRLDGERAARFSHLVRKCTPPWLKLQSCP